MPCIDSLFMVFTATLSTESSWVSEPSMTEPNSPAHTHTHTHTHLQSDHQFRQYSTPIPAAHLPRVFFPALACVCPPSRPAASAWAHRWSPESLLRTEPVTWEISIRASLSVFNNMWKNNVFFREKPGFGIDIMLFHLCTVIRSSSDTINQSQLRVKADICRRWIHNDFCLHLLYFKRVYKLIMCYVQHF